MIVVPAWIQSETTDGVLAVLGSEPPADALPIFLPRSCVASCVVSPESPLWLGRRFGIVVLDQNSIPPSVAKALGLAR